MNPKLEELYLLCQHIITPEKINKNVSIVADIINHLTFLVEGAERESESSRRHQQGRRALQQARSQVWHRNLD